LAQIGEFAGQVTPFVLKLGQSCFHTSDLVFETLSVTTDHERDGGKIGILTTSPIQWPPRGNS
jgi:hypothetical protein